MTGTIQEPRRHHYVPRCWLAGFTDTGESDGRLWVTDFSRQKQWQTTPANAGHTRDFYRLSEAPDPVIVEKFFSDLEDQVAPVLKNIDRERRQPTNDELTALLTFMAYQWVRVPHFRPFTLSVLDQFTREKIVKELETPETWRAALLQAGQDPIAPGADYERMKTFMAKGDYTLSATNEWYIQRGFTDANEVFGSLSKRYWSVLFANQGTFIGSDNPVVMDGERDVKIGFESAPVVLYPISRHALLTGTQHREQYIAQSPDLVANFNSLMLAQADDQVYSAVPDFPWHDRQRQQHNDWKLFAKERC